MRTLAAFHTTKPKLGLASFSDKSFIKNIHLRVCLFWFLDLCSFCMIFCIGVFLNLNGAWSWLIRYHVAVYTDTGLERLDYKKNIRLNRETNRARLSLCMNKQAAKNQPIGKWFGEQLLFIHRWQKCGPTARATTEGPGGPHRGHAGKLINSTVNGSTSGSPVKTPNAGLEGNKASAEAAVDKGTIWTSVGEINDILQWKKRQKERSRNLSRHSTIWKMNSYATAHLGLSNKKNIQVIRNWI